MDQQILPLGKDMFDPGEIFLDLGQFRQGILKIFAPLIW